MSRTIVALGHAVERYPDASWDHIPKDVSLESLWQIVGPQVDRHMNRLPLWKVFCVVYFEGLAHGVQGRDAAEQQGKESQ